MELTPLIFQHFKLKDAGSIVDALFSRLDEVNDRRVESDYKNGRACAYAVGRSAGIQLEYANPEGGAATLTVGISAPTRREFRAVRTYLMEQLKEIAPDYNILNIEQIKRTRHPKKTKEQ